MANFTPIGVEAVIKGEQDFVKGLDNMGGAIGGIGKIAAKVATAGVAAVGVAIATVGGIAAKTIPMASEFADSVTSLGIAAKDSGLSFDELHDAALQVGGDSDLLGVSAAGAADSMTGLYKAGLTTTEIFGDLNGYLAGTAELGGAMRGAIDLAAASELDMVQASDLAAVTLATFGGELETEAERAEFITGALNNLVKAADASVADVSDLAEALKNVGPTASAFGFSLEDTNNALAILSTRGIKGAEAGTALKSMLTNIMRPTDQVKGALKALNVELYDEQGALKPLPTILEDFQGALMDTRTITQEVSMLTEDQNQELEWAAKAWKQADDAIGKHNLGLKTLTDKTLGKYQDQLANAESVLLELGSANTETVTSTRKLTEEQRNQSIQTLAGTFGMKAMQTLLAEGTEGWDAMSAATERATGIQEQAAAKAATLSGQWEAFQGNMETFGIQIGEIFMPFAGELLQWASDLASQYGPPIIEWAQAMGKVIFDRVVPAIQAAGAWLGEMLPRAIQFLSDLWTGTLQPALEEGAGIWEQRVIPVLEVLSGWFQQILPTAIDVAVTYWNTYLLPLFQSLADQWTEKVQPALADLWAWLQEKVPQAIETAAQFWEETLKPALAVVAEFVTETLIPAIGDVVTWLIENIPGAIETAAKFWEETLKPALETVWEFIQESVIPAIEDVVAWLQENIPKAIETATEFWEETLLPALTTVWEFIRDKVIPIIEDVIGWLQENIPKAIETASNAWEETLKPALKVVWDFLEEYLFPAFEAVAGFMEVAGKVAIEAFALLWEKTLKPKLEAVWEYFDEYILPVFEALRKITEEDVQPVLETFSKFLDTVFGKSLKKIAEAFNKAKDALSGLLKKLQEWRTKDIPEPYIGKSPPPLANWLGQIGAEMAVLSQVQIPALTAQMGGLGRVTMGGIGAGGGGGVTNNNNITLNATVSGGIGAAAFQARTLRTVEGALAA